MNSQGSCVIAIAVFFVSLYSLFCIGHYGGDGYEDFLTAKSIVLNHSLAFKGSSDSSESNDIDELNYKKDAGIKGRDGRIYSSRGGIIIPIILSIFYFIGHIISGSFKSIPHDFITMFFVSFFNPIVSAMNCLLIFLISSCLPFSRRTSIFLALIYGLATMVPVYARTGFEEPAMTSFILLAIYFILRFKNTVKRKYLVMGGIAMGLAVFTKSTAIIFLPAIIFYAGWVMLSDLKKRSSFLKDAAMFLIPLLAVLVVIIGCNYFIYGKMLKFGGREALSVAGRVMEAPHVLKGLYYYLFSTGKGLFLFNLPLILSFAGLMSVPSKRRKEAALFILIFACNLLFFSMSFRRGSLFAWGPRYLYPSVAALVFLAGFFIENNRNLKGNLIAAVLSVTGFLIMAPCMFINQSKFYLFVKEKLNLPEYMINFIPDLSPILGAWKMFVSNLIFIARGIDAPFVYSPDQKFIPVTSASMAGYNNFDFWFTKILYYKPESAPAVYGIILALAAVVFISLVFIIREARKRGV